MSSFPGTSIGFKNIASKIANELKLWLPGSAPRRRRRPRRPSPSPSPSASPSPSPSPSPPPPPPRCDSLRLSAEDMVLVANAGLRTPSGTLAHYLTDYRSDYLRPPEPRAHPRSSLSLRAETVDVDVRVIPHTVSVHTLRRQSRVHSPALPLCDCLPVDPIPPPELFDFWNSIFLLTFASCSSFEPVAFPRPRA